MQKKRREKKEEVRRKWGEKLARQWGTLDKPMGRKAAQLTLTINRIWQPCPALVGTWHRYTPPVLTVIAKSESTFRAGGKGT